MFGAGTIVQSGGHPDASNGFLIGLPAWRPLHRRRRREIDEGRAGGLGHLILEKFATPERRSSRTANRRNLLRSMFWFNCGIPV